jgi:drug/metabolite transporter, DME family
MESSPIRHRLTLVAAALLFSTGGAVFKAISLNGWQVACFRSGIAALVMVAALPEARQGWSWRMAPVGLAYAATLVSFVVANKLTTSANAIFLQSTAPLYLLLLGPWLLREPLRRADILYLAGVFAGITLFFVGTESAVATAPNPPKGNLIALGSGVVYALMLAGLRWLARAPHSAGLGASVLGNIFAFVCTLPLALPVEHVKGTDVALLLYLGTIQIGLAYILLTRGIRHVRAVEATTVLMIEPAMNPFWSWLVHGETPSALSLSGGVLILAASIVNTWKRARWST